MFYDEQPVFHDPASNTWFGFQVWSMERVAEYYYVTGDAEAKVILAGAFAKTLIYYSAGTREWATHHTASQMMAKQILDRIWTICRDEQGVSILESRSDYNRFDDPIFIGGPVPTFRYHRFWAQVDVALANAEYGRLFP
jgi:hypothetical protein